MIIHARTLVALSTDELWDTFTGAFTLVFDNGEKLETNARATIYSSYAWEFHRRYPGTPLLPEHHVTGILGNRRLSSDTHSELLGNVMWATYDYYVAHPQELSQLTGNPPLTNENEFKFRDSLALLIYQTANKMYNDISYRTEEHIVSIDILDFMEVSEEPSIKAANHVIQTKEFQNHVEVERCIADTYSAIQTAINESPLLANNAISLAAKSGLVKTNQLLQCIGPRGLLTDIDSDTFAEPVRVGYFDGIRSIGDSLMESRSAAKSLLFSKSPLEQAEYFSRRLQLVSQIVKRLHVGDCGSTNYTFWHVRPRMIENGVITHPGDLKQLIGKKYMDDDGVLKTIRAGDKHLIGRTLKLRQVYHCQHPDPYGVCSTCFGELSLSIPNGRKTNLGQICCTSLAAKSSQLVLSVKHYDGSSAVEGIILDPEDKKYLKVSSDGMSYLLADRLKGKSVKIVIPAAQASKISDIMVVADISDLNITRVSEISDATIVVTTEAMIDEWAVEVNLNRRMASFSYDMLNHIRANGWSIDERGNYVFDMTGWDWSKNVMTLPLRHFNMSDHSRFRRGWEQPPCKRTKSVMAIVNLL